MTRPRDYVKTDRDLLADELVELIAQWRSPKLWWWERASVGHVICVKVWYRLNTITQALRGGEGK